jgi:hypothetical protein
MGDLDTMDHDVLKRALLHTLSEYTNQFQDSATDVVVHEEKPVTVDGRERRADVMLMKENEFSVEPSAKYAFEVKTTLADSIGAASQLRDYAAADCHPILVAADYLFDENESLLDNASGYGPVIGATTHATGEFSFDVIDGNLSRIGLTGLTEHWEELVSYATGDPDDKHETTTEDVSLPWIYQRESPVTDRSVTKQLHLQDETARKFVEFQNQIETQLNEDVYRADLREAAILAAIERPGLVVDQLVQWGYQPESESQN